MELPTVEQPKHLQKISLEMKLQIMKWRKGTLKAACAIKEGDAIFRSDQCERMTLASGLVNKIAGSGGLSLRKKGGKNSGDKLTRTPFQRRWEA